jgi:RNA polymerase sigma factor (TIGR02999 family)
MAWNRRILFSRHATIDKKMDLAEGDITRLLGEWRAGDDTALERLIPMVYGHLHEVAQAYLQGERPEHTLQATALVNELFLRLMKNQQVRYENREHFYTFAARVMRRILVEHARKATSKKRGDGAQRIALAPELAWIDADSAELLDLDQALAELATLDPDKVRILEIRFFLGMTAADTAELLGRSRSSVNRDATFAISWLHRRLSAGQNRSDLRQLD